MSEATKKIWVRELPRKEDGVLIGLSYHTEPEGLENGTEHQYIRADIFDELVDALKGLIESTTHICEGAYGPGMDGSFDKARAALKKLEESHD